MSFWKPGESRPFSPIETQRKGRARMGPAERVGRTIIKIANFGMHDRTTGETMDRMRRRSHWDNQANPHSPATRRATQQNSRNKGDYR